MVYFDRVVYYLIMIFGFMVTLNLENFHVLKEILLIEAYVLSML